MNIVDLIRSETRPYANKPALIEPAAGVTYGELLDRADRVADELRERGVRPTQRVALLAGDSIDYVAINLAVLSLSAVAVPISPSLAIEEVQSVLDTMGVHRLVTERPGGLGPGEDRLAPHVLSDRQFTVRGLPNPAPAPPEYARLNPAFIRFSSGTTGASKGVLLSHESIEARTTAADRALRISPADTVIWLLSMSYHFVVSILLFLRRAATIVLCEQDFPASLTDALIRHRGTFAYGSPFHYQALSASPVFRREHLAGLRMAVCTAMRLPQHTAAAFLEKFGIPLSGAYGIIEVGLPFVNAPADPSRPTSVGRILPDYEIRIDSPNADGLGLIRLRGPGMFDAYYAPWQTRDQALRDGWFDTGDLGRLDPDGTLHILGRTKELINFAGMKIFPQEVEEVLLRHPAVEECLVYGEPHPEYGQLPCVRIVPDPDHPGSLDLTEIRRFCYRHLAAYQVPKKFDIVDRIEKTASNKLRRA